MAFPGDYWQSYEHPIGSLGDFLESVRQISAFEAQVGATFVWRGAANADWPMYSSLVRDFIRKYRHVPTEIELRDYEIQVIAEARDWGLDWHASGGRLAALELLAALQHYGIPTRMIDFTFNPLIALWFAVEKHSDVDGRIFAIDILPRTVDRSLASGPDPWWLGVEPKARSDWSTESWIWKPPPFEARMVRQDGCFLMGGIPSTIPPRNANLAGGWTMLRADEVRECMSVPFRLIQYRTAQQAFAGRAVKGGTPEARAFTLRVTNKAVLRDELQRGFGLSHRSLFPDFPGLAEYGQSFVGAVRGAATPRSQPR